MPDYKVNRGIEYPPDKRAEEGDIVSDIPSKSVKWLLEDGIIEVVGGNAKKNKVDLVIKDEPVVEEAPIIDDAPVVETVEQEDSE